MNKSEVLRNLLGKKKWKIVMEKRKQKERIKGYMRIKGGDQNIRGVYQERKKEKNEEKNR